jgi:glutathione S-transferase
MNTTTTQPVSLKVTRLIKAPRERVFNAWITPSDMMKWFGTETCQTLSAKVDARVGGEFQIKVKGENGDKTIGGVYREIKAPSKLVFTWNSCGCMPQMEGISTVVTVDFAEQKNGTIVTITHEGFPDSAARDGHNAGWTALLENLEKMV